MTAHELYPYFLAHRGISIDTRSLKAGDLFFCLSGDWSNGHRYASDALDKGASLVVMDDKEVYRHFAGKDQAVLVDSSLVALQTLARVHRSTLSIPIIGITGSNGKTTSKELIRSVLAQKYTVFATHGNLNNHLGVPLSLLSIGEEIEIAVLEMGANHQKEIEFLCELARPDFGLITNIGRAHLEGFGGVEGILKGKKELFDFLKAHQGLSFIYMDDPKLQSLSGDQDRKVTYGTGPGVDLRGRILETYPQVKIEWNDKTNSTHTAQSNVSGAYNLSNILASVAIGTYFGVSTEAIGRGIEQYFPVNNRSQLRKEGNHQVLMDFYNANPDSMEGALENLRHFPYEHKIAILGDMLELGTETMAEHRAVLNTLQTMSVDSVLLVGDQFFILRDEFPSFSFVRNTLEAEKIIQSWTIPSSLILVKGSRGVHLENLMPFLKA